MAHFWNVEYTDTFSGEANYSWVKRKRIAMPDMTHYGYTGSCDGSFAKAERGYNRELMRQAKAAMGLTGIRGATSWHGDCAEFRPYGMATVLFITWCEHD